MGGRESIGLLDHLAEFDQAEDENVALVERAPTEIRPQEGPQELFLSSDADIAIYGGSAYSGKTFALLIDPVRWCDAPNFAAVIFRRSTPQITNPGGLWDESRKAYAGLGTRPLSNSLTHLFPSGAVVKFAHLERADTVYGWDGSQVPVLGFDQLEHFEEGQFFYMLSRNRDPSGTVRPYCRATCNPDPDSWLADFLAWWIDDRKTLDDGAPNPGYGYARWDRAGLIRWFVRVDETLHWADTRQELIAKFGRPDLPDEHPEQARPMSVTFIPGRIWDNKIGLERDPGYLAKLRALPRFQRERLLGDAKLGGNWRVRASAGTLFRREWCQTIPAEPEGVDWVRAWDLAGTPPNPQNPDPDWTVGVKLGKYRGRNRWVLARAVRDRLTPAGVEQLMENVAQADGAEVEVEIPQDPGQAGKAQVAALIGKLAGYQVRAYPVTGDKVTRFSPFSAQAEAGNVDLVAGLPEDFLRSLEAFGEDVKHDDDADAVSTAFRRWAQSGGPSAMLAAMRQEAEKALAAAAAAADPVAASRAAAAEREYRTTHDLRGTAARDPVLPRSHRPPAPPAPTVAEVEAERARGRGEVPATSSFVDAVAAARKGSTS